MAIALPIVEPGRVLGTGFVAGMKGETAAVVTALHLLGSGASEIRVGLPSHGGDLAKVQVYPQPRINALPSRLVTVDPALDLAVLLVPSLRSPVPARFVASVSEVKVGEEVAVIGYPFAPLGSILETFEPCVVSAVAEREVLPGVRFPELVLMHYTHPGSSGSPVVRLSDGAICGVVRGCLAPPEFLQIGGLPVGGDSTVTYATLAAGVPALVADALRGA